MKNKTTYIVFLFKWGLRVAALSGAVSAASLLEQGQHGKGLVQAGSCLLYLYLSWSDLEQLWAMRHMSVWQAARLASSTIQLTLLCMLSYLLFFIGIVLQLFFE